MSARIAQYYTRLLELWPKDPLRPALPFTRTIEHRGAPFGVKPISPPADSETAPPKPAASPPSPKLEQSQINALYSLLEDRYSKRYPLSPDLFKPKSAPEHYDRLMKEISRAPTKTWLQSKLDEWKMKIRWN